MQQGSPQDGESRLVALKAVTPDYPLKGTLMVLPDEGEPASRPEAVVKHPNNSTRFDRAPVPSRGVPAPGTVWVDPGALEALNLQVGDQLGLGELSLRIDRVLVSEPDRGMSFMSFAPRVLMNAKDLPASELIQPASRVTWRLALTGPAASLERFLDWSDEWLKGPQAKGVRLDTLQSGRPEMRQTLDRAVQFMHLVGLLSALLCAVAVAMAAHHFSHKKLSDCALMRVMGQSQSVLTQMFFWEFVAVGLLASALGVALGWLTHWGFVSVLERWLDQVLAAGDWSPAWNGLGSGLLLLLAGACRQAAWTTQAQPLWVSSGERLYRRAANAERFETTGVSDMTSARIAAAGIDMAKLAALK